MSFSGVSICYGHVDEIRRIIQRIDELNKITDIRQQRLFLNVQVLAYAMDILMKSGALDVWAEATYE